MDRFLHHDGERRCRWRIHTSGKRGHRLGDGDDGGDKRRDTWNREKDKYLSEHGFSLWSTIRAILTSLRLGRQKMPVSRCARLKNDRRGAEPGSTALVLSPSLSLSRFPLVFFCLDPSPRYHPFSSRNDASSSFPLWHLKIETSFLVAPIPVASFSTFLFSFLFSPRRSARSTKTR